MTNRFPNRLIGPATLTVVLCAALSCVTLERNPEVVGTYSDKLSPNNYKEEGDVLMMVVGVESARLIRNEPYFPVFVLVANKSRETLTLTRESFMLEDPLGRQYAMAPAREVQEKYHRIDLDRQMFRRNASMTGTYVGIYTRMSSAFYPSSARRSVQINAVTLPPKTYMEDVLYYPIPESGLNDVPLRLVFSVKELPEPIPVVFSVPKTLGVFEKEEEDPS